jgi:hypothetical protein
MHKKKMLFLFGFLFMFACTSKRLVPVFELLAMVDCQSQKMFAIRGDDKDSVYIFSIENGRLFSQIVSKRNAHPTTEEFANLLASAHVNFNTSYLYTYCSAFDTTYYDEAIARMNMKDFVNDLGILHHEYSDEQNIPLLAWKAMQCKGYLTKIDETGGYQFIEASRIPLQIENCKEAAKAYQELEN